MNSHRPDRIPEPTRRDSVAPPPGTLGELALSDIECRPPREEDAARVWELVQQSERLAPNSPYAYLLLCTHFAETGLVAIGGAGQLAGFALGYRLPEDRSCLFIWQLGVAEPRSSPALGLHLLEVLFDRCAERRPLAFLEATVTPSDPSSRVLFTRFARDRTTRVRESVAFWSSSFPATREVASPPPEDEIRLRIGPIRTT